MKLNCPIISRINRKTDGRITRETIIYLKEEYPLCYICGNSFEKGFEIDHIVPISKGGTNNKENLALACQSCNRQKSNKTLEQYLKDGGGVNSLY